MSKPYTSALSAPSEARRSKKRLATFIDMHNQLRKDVVKLRRIRIKANSRKVEA